MTRRPPPFRPWIIEPPAKSAAGRALDLLLVALAALGLVLLLVGCLG